MLGGANSKSNDYSLIFVAHLILNNILIVKDIGHISSDKLKGGINNGKRKQTILWTRF